MRDYACLQLCGNPGGEAARERLIYAVTAYMDSRGLVSCRKESAERTVCFAPTAKGWAVFDDCADRLDLCELNGMGRFLTGKLRCRGVGVMCAGQGLLLTLYADGRLRDTYITSKRPFSGTVSLPAWVSCRGHALQWRSQLAVGTSLKALADLFAQGERGGRTVFSQLRLALDLDESAGYGFSCLEDARPQGLISLYFCPSNVVKQSLLDRIFHPARRAAVSTGALLHIRRGD